MSQTIFSKCNRCQLVSYCSKECQTTDWKKNHKKKCLSLVSKPNVTVFDNLRDAVRSGCSINAISEIISRNNVDMGIVATKLLFEAVSAGNMTLVDWLLLDESNLKPVDIVDEEGRNIIMVMLMKNRRDLFHHIVFSKINGDIYSCVDPLGNNMLHYVVLTKDCDVLEFVLSRKFQVNNVSDYAINFVQGRASSLTSVFIFENSEDAPSEGRFLRGLHEWKNKSGKTPRDLALSMYAQFTIPDDLHLNIKELFILTSIF
jgi:hypothetical protein